MFREVDHRTQAVACNEEAAWFLSGPRHELHRVPFTPSSMVPLSAKANVQGAIVDIRIADGALLVDGRVSPLPESGTPIGLIVHPTLPLVWVALGGFLVRGDRGVVIGIDLQAEVVVASVGFTPTRSMQIVDVDGDGNLELVAGQGPTLVLDAATGALEQELPGSVRFAPDDVGFVGPAPFAEPVGVVDLDGNGELETVERDGLALTVSGDDFTIALGAGGFVVAGPGRHELSVVGDEGVVTWPLRCE